MATSSNTAAAQRGFFDSLADFLSATFDLVGEVIGTVFDAVVWLVDTVFDIAGSFLDWIGSVLRDLGNSFKRVNERGDTAKAGILPISEEVKNLIDKYDEVELGNYSQLAKDGKVSLSYVKDADGVVQRVQFTGSTEGFSEEIKSVHSQGKTAAVSI